MVLHYTTQHYTTLHYTTPHHTTLHYTTLHHMTSQYLQIVLKAPLSGIICVHPFRITPDVKHFGKRNRETE